MQLTQLEKVYLQFRWRCQAGKVNTLNNTLVYTLLLHMWPCHLALTHLCQSIRSPLVRQWKWHSKSSSCLSLGRKTVRTVAKTTWKSTEKSESLLICLKTASHNSRRVTTCASRPQTVWRKACWNGDRNQQHQHNERGVFLWFLLCGPRFWCRVPGHWCQRP